MEENNFLIYLKNLEKEKIVCFNNSIQATITDIEQYDYNLLKISIIIDNIKFNGLFLNHFLEFFFEYNQKLLINKISISELRLLKTNVHENIKILIKHDDASIKIKKINYESQKQDNIKTTYNLSEFPKILNSSKNENEYYESGIFIYQSKKAKSITLKTFEELKIITAKIGSKDKDILKEINGFFDSISKETIIYIDNYLVKNRKIKFNNFTCYFIADGECLSKYFKKKYNRNESYYNQDIYYNLPLKEKKKSNYLFIKVILIDEEYITGIEQCPKLYKIKKYKDKLNQINDIYTFVLIRNYDEKIKDNINIIILRDDSNILTFENTFFDSFINNLTAININFIDFNEKDNYYKEIGVKNNFSLKIIKKNDNIIVNILFL